MLAVSFVVSAFVLGDGLRSSFTNVSKTSPPVSTSRSATPPTSATPPPLPPDTVATVADVDGVADAVANIESADNAVRPIRPNGESIPTNGPPQLAFNWIDNPQLSPFTLVAGAPPHGRRVHDGRRFRRQVRLRDRRHLPASMSPRGRVDLHAVGNVVVRRRQLDARRGVDADEHRPGQRAVRHRRHHQRGRAGRRRSRTSPTCRPRSPQRTDGRGRRSRRPCRRDHHGFTNEIDVVGNILLGIRCSRPVRVDLHHLQHVRDRARPAHPRARAAAHRRRRPAADPALGASARRSSWACSRRSAASRGGIAVAKGIDCCSAAIGVDLSALAADPLPRDADRRRRDRYRRHDGRRASGPLGEPRRCRPSRSSRGCGDADVVGSRTRKVVRRRLVRCWSGLRSCWSGRRAARPRSPSPRWRSAWLQSSSESLC